jgi:hypothetical protein
MAFAIEQHHGRSQQLQAGSGSPPLNSLRNSVSFCNSFFSSSSSMARRSASRARCSALSTRGKSPGAAAGALAGVPARGGPAWRRGGAGTVVPGKSIDLQ